MSSSPGTLFLSALWGGAAASVFAPLLWPIVVLIEQGRISFSFLFALPSVAFIALLSGLVFSAIVGFPLLAVLDRRSRSRLLKNFQSRLLHWGNGLLRIDDSFCTVE